MDKLRNLGDRAKSPEGFWAVSIIAVFIQLVAVFAFSQAPVSTTLLIAGWNAAPIVVPMILFCAGARHVAWGWLIPTALWGTWVSISVVTSDSSTAALGFMWGSVWNFSVFGPIGAVVAVLAARKSKRERSEQ